MPIWSANGMLVKPERKLHSQRFSPLSAIQDKAEKRKERSAVKVCFSPDRWLFSRSRALLVYVNVSDDLLVFNLTGGNGRWSSGVWSFDCYSMRPSPQSLTNIKHTRWMKMCTKCRAQFASMSPDVSRVCLLPSLEDYFMIVFSFSTAIQNK